MTRDIPVFVLDHDVQVIYSFSYHNDLQFSDRQVLANSVDPDQTA